MNKRLFIIDDEPDMVKIATALLEAGGYTVCSDTHPASGLKKVRANPPDLLLLDLRLPDMDGFSVCKELKSDPKTRHLPIIMVSVRSEEMDVVMGLNGGADDFISKPFRRRELLARVNSVLRRVGLEAEVEKVEVKGLCVDFAGYSATANKKKLDLTAKEFELLGYFLRRQGRMLTRANISEAVWGFEHTGSSRTIDVHVDKLRRKLGRYGTWIKGLKGIGYRFEADH